MNRLKTYLIFALIAVLLMAATAKAEAVEQKELVVLLVANDGFSSLQLEDGDLNAPNESFFKALHTFVRTAEMRGNGVELFGPSIGNNSIHYKTGQDWDRMVQLSNVPVQHDKPFFAQNTFKLLENVNLQHKDVIVFLGQLQDEDIDTWRRAAGYLKNAESVFFVDVCGVLSLESTDSKIDIVDEKIETQKVRLVQNSLNDQPDQVDSIHPYTEQALGSSVEHMLQSKIDQDNSIRLIPFDEALNAEQQMIKVLYSEKEFQIFHIKKAGANTWSLPVFDEYMDTPVLILHSTDDQVQLSSPSGNLVTSEDLQVIRVDQDTSLVSLVDLFSESGEWQVQTENEIDALVYFNEKPIYFEKPVIQANVSEDDGNWEWRLTESKDGKMIYEALKELDKRKIVNLKMNSGYETIQKLKTLYQDKLILRIEQGAQREQGTEITMETPSNSGTYDLKVRLYAANYLLGEQDFRYVVINRPPQAVSESLPYTVQEKYWELQKNEGPLFVNLHEIMEDPDGDVLEWKIAIQSDEGKEPVFMESLDADGILISTSDEQLNIEFQNVNDGMDQLSFLIKGEDRDQNQPEEDTIFLTLHWRNLREELNAMTAQTVNKELFDVEQHKNNDMTLHIGFSIDDNPISQEIWNLLTEGTDIHVFWNDSASKSDVAKSSVHNDDQHTLKLDYTTSTIMWDSEKREALIHVTSPSITGTYDIVLSMETNKDNVVAWTKTWTLHERVSVENQRPFIETLRENDTWIPWTIHSQKTLNPQMQDNDLDNPKLQYIVSQSYRLFPWQSTTNKIIDSEIFDGVFSPSKCGTWEIEFWAFDGEEKSENSAVYVITVWSLKFLLIAGIIALILLVAIILIIVWLCKPQFKKEAQVKVHFDDKDKIDLNLGNWGRRGVPLNRVLPEVCHLILSSELCGKLSKIIIMPARRGKLFIIDKTGERLLPSQKKKEQLSGKMLLQTMDKIQITIIEEQSEV